MMSIVLGALFAALVYRYLRDQSSQLEAARRAAGGATVEVLVADEEIPIGTVIEGSKVRLAAWPSELLPEGALRNPEQAVGRVARVTIEKHQPLVESRLVSPGAGLLPLLITEGMRGMSVKVDQVTGVSGFITPNSRVDVLVSGRPTGSGNQDQRSKMILQNVRVLATGMVIEQVDEKPKEVPTVTLLVTPDEAEKLTLASRQQAVSLALRNYSDQEIVKTKGMSDTALFASDDRGSGATRARGSGARRPSVEVLLGEKLTRQPLL
jgi:pilus assembly protein CpaB